MSKIAVQKKRTRCGLNLLYIRPGYMGGTVRYAFSLFNELLSLDCFEWYVYVREGVYLPPIFYQTGVNLRIIPVCGSLVGRVVYEQLLLPSRVKKDKVKLLFSPGFVGPLRGGFVKVVAVHDLYFRLFPHLVRPWQRWYWRLFIPLSMNSSDAIITISKTTYRDLVSYYPWLVNKLYTIYLGVVGEDVSCLKTDANSGETYCLVIGNITPNKNIGLVIDAIKEVNRDGLGCRLKIVGNDTIGELQSYLKHNGGGELVDLYTGLGDDELLAAYRGALCTIQASVYEGFGLPVLEAMSQGSPVIISDADALVEIAGGAALVFGLDSGVNGLSSCVKRMITEDELREYHRELGMKRVKDFSWKATASNTARLFCDLLED